MSESLTVRICTTDDRWADAHGGRLDTGDVAVTVGPVERLTFAGQPMVRFFLADAPSDYGNQHVMLPVRRVVAA